MSSARCVLWSRRAIPHPAPGPTFRPVPQPSLASPCTHTPATTISPASETRAMKNIHPAKDATVFSLHHMEHLAVSFHARILLHTTGVTFRPTGMTFRPTASKPRVGAGILDALSAGTLCHARPHRQAGGRTNTIPQHPNPQECCQQFQYGHRS